MVAVPLSRVTGPGSHETVRVDLLIDGEVWPMVMDVRHVAEAIEFQWPATRRGIVRAIAIDRVLAALHEARSIEMRAPGIAEHFPVVGAAEALDLILDGAKPCADRLSARWSSPTLRDRGRAVR
jgi:hypothetical protein